MAQPTISDYLKSYTGILGRDIGARYGYSDPLLHVFRNRREKWLEESGFVLKKDIYERPKIVRDPTAEFADGDNAAFPEAVKANNTTNYGGSSSGAGAYDSVNNIDPPTDTLKFSYDERGYGLIQKAFNTDDISIESLRSAAKRRQQINAVTTLLARTSKEYWIRIFRDEFNRIANHRFVCTGNSSQPTFVENSDRFECYDSTTAARWNAYGFESTSYDVAGTIDTPDKQGTSELKFGHLEDLYERMIQDGMGELADVYVDGQPVFMLLTSMKTQQALITESTQNGRDLRTDIRESSMADALLKPMGVTHSIKGFMIVSMPAPRRFTITGDPADSSGAVGTGGWTEQTFYANDATENKRDVRAAYRSATHEESYVIVPRALSCFAPNPFTGAGAAKFKPQDYSGHYAFKVQETKADNPDGAHGYFRARFMTASVAEEPLGLYVLRHKKGTGTQA